MSGPTLGARLGSIRMKFSTSSGLGRAFGLVPGLAVIAAAGSLLVIDERIRPRTAQASDLDTSDDYDGDGISDLQERILLTDPQDADSDDDGYSDSEELARKSSPLVANILPQFGRMKLGSTMRGESQCLHLVLAIYLPTLDFTGSDLRLGIVTPRRAAEFSFAQVSAMADVQILPAQLGTATVVMIDLPLSPSLVPLVGDLNLYATVGTSGSGRIASATVARLRRVDGRIVYCMPMPDMPDGSGDDTMGFTESSSGGGAGGSGGGGSTPPAPGGTLYQPLQVVGDSAIPWSPGMICYQHSSPVGALGAAVTYEVTQSECVDNWDAICPPSCSTSVGSTYAEIDPLGLMGG